VRIAVIGLGLIGGSLAWDWTEAGHEVWGFSRTPETCAYALAQGMISGSLNHLQELGEQGWDGVVVCTPIADVLPTVAEVAPLVSASTLVTDVASVKGSLVRSATALCAGFVGGHPMAGTAGQGIRAAQRELFRGAVYVVTPVPETQASGLERLGILIGDLGAEVVRCDPDDHDQAVAAISHGPVWLSAALIATAREQGSLAQRLASSGFRDTSRVGGGNPALGVGMARANREAVVVQVRRYQAHLAQIQMWLEQEDWERLEDFLQQTHCARRDFRSCG